MHEAEPPRRFWLRRWLNRLEVDRAVFFAVAARGWQLLAGPVTVVFIALFFTPEVQGYYYTFWSLLALQAFAELGFQLVIIYVASHEWAHLGLDDAGDITGEADALARLASLARLVVKWYSVAALAFVASVGIAGFVFFSQKPTTIDWLPPWLTLVVLTGLSLGASSLIAMLEGCNQVATVNRFRLLQAMSGHAAVWTSMWLGAQLWVAVIALGVKLVWETYVIAVHYRRFWQSLLRSQATAVLDWRSDVWPMQWRIAVGSVVQYFALHLFTPVMFYFHSVELAGRMGMTWTVLTAFQAAAFAWVQTRMPLFGMLIVRRDFRELDRVFVRLTVISLAILVAAGAALCGAVAVLNTWPHPLAEKLAARLLPPVPTLIFTLGVILLHIPRCQSLYLRAHKRDPLMTLYVASNALLGLAVFFLGKSPHGPTAAACGFLAVTALINLPGTAWIWRRCRTDWHADERLQSPPAGR